MRSTNEILSSLKGYDNIGAIIAGVDEDYDEVGEGDMISGPEALESELAVIEGLADSRMALARLGRLRMRPNFQARAGRLGKVVTRVSRLSRQLLVQTGRIEAEYLRRPNTLVSVYTTSLAPAATSAFSVQPGQGNSFYRLMGFICSDEQANLFAFTNLTVGGQNHVQFNQSTPAAPVTNAVPWAPFALKEGRLATNLAPWTGQLFDNSTPVTGTIANITVAATTDAFTGAARIVLLTQTDPCSYRSAITREAAQSLARMARRGLGLFAPMGARI